MLIFLFFLLTSPLSSPPPNVHYEIRAKPALVLYYTHYCPYSRQVLTYLKEINKTVLMKNVAEDEAAKIELKTLGGKLEVPCLLIDGTPFYNSAVIIDWVSQHLDALDDAAG
jgi:glutaredoxin